MIYRTSSIIDIVFNKEMKYFIYCHLNLFVSHSFGDLVMFLNATEQDWFPLCIIVWLYSPKARASLFRTIHMLLFCFQNNINGRLFKVGYTLANQAVLIRTSGKVRHNPTMHCCQKRTFVCKHKVSNTSFTDWKISPHSGD